MNNTDKSLSNKMGWTILIMMSYIIGKRNGWRIIMKILICTCCKEKKIR